jgi:ribonuclease HI
LNINVDGGFDENSGEDATGVVIRNSKGEVILTAWNFFEAGGNAEEMEALACKEGLRLATECCPQEAILETDCSSIATMLKARNGGRSSLKFVIEEAIQIGDRLRRWTIVHRRRESNRVAHELAQLAKRSRQSDVWHFAAPVCVEQEITQDCNFTPE